jgi:hypothetical protein
MLALGAIVALVVGWQVAAFSLTGSNFEIDEDANLVVNNTGKDDWESIPQNTQPPGEDPDPGSEIRGIDLPTGSTDDSYQGGVKEDTVCPDEVTGSIPNNKSDLRTFHVYEEPGNASNPAGYLNLAWSRVTDPTGTTLMDFEFNQSSTGCSVGPNVVRTEGDLLIEYSIDQGGSRATITRRLWTNSGWGTAQTLSTNSATCGGNPCAEGTINSTPIEGEDSDGIIPDDEQLAERTFGEAQIDLRLLFQPNKCSSFGSAMLKSRSSDSFTSQLKDFIAPVNIDVQNCGKVIIRKQTDPASDPATTQFGYTKSFGTDPASANTFTLGNGESKTFDNVLFGSGHTVTEDVLPEGWDFRSLDCSDSVGVEEVPAGTPGGYTIDGKTVTFDIDDENDVLDCTYTNRARGTIIVEKITDNGTGSFPFTSNTLTPSSFSLTTTGAGAAGKASQTFADLAPGTYDVAETVPAGWNLVGGQGSCDDGSAPDAIDLSAGETVTCTFHDARETGAIEITKTRKHAAAGPGDHPHVGVTFTVTGGELPAGGVEVVTDANGEACVDGLVLSSLLTDGDYTVTEQVPDGYVSDDPDNAQTVTVDTEASCDLSNGNASTDGEQVSFHNTPLTDITVSVDSQVDGGTASTITCGNDSADTDENGDGSLTLADREPNDQNTPPGLTCTIVIDP